jgi:hypothetical protein
MYLRELFIKNNGPIRELHLELTFGEDDRPIPHLIVGRNGSGKTNFLSMVAEGLMFGASGVYNDVLSQQGLARSFFRILGGKTTTYGEPGEFAIFRFREGEQDLFFREYTESFTAADAVAILPDSLKSGANWTEKRTKDFGIPEEDVRKIYQSGVYTFFPSSRSEQPHWLNPTSLVSDEYEVKDNFESSLGKPMFVEHGINDFAQWLLGVLTESRLSIKSARNLTDAEKQGIEQNQVVVQLEAEPYMRTQAPLILANDILKIITDDADAFFVWTGRNRPRKVGVFSKEGQTIATGLDALSGGQATLLAIFGTILRYGDMAERTSTDLKADEMQGIVLIDELDAHMHIDLQVQALPRLIAMFPRIQFIVSSHSPFFALGMEKNFPNNGVRIIDLPTGLAVGAETYDEFGSALDVLMETHAFEQKIGEFLAAAEDPVVWLAGETDVPYFQTAAKLLGYPQLVNYFRCIGVAGTSGSGGGEYTGDGHLKAAIKFLRNNAGFTSRTVIAVYDNDAKQTDDEFDNVHIIALQTIDGAAVENGVENLLPAHVFTPDVFQEVVKSSGIVGKPKILPEVRKTLLAEKLCGEDADPANFQNFAPYLERINAILTLAAGGSADDVPAESLPEGQTPPAPQTESD